MYINIRFQFIFSVKQASKDASYLVIILGGLGVMGKLQHQYITFGLIANWNY
jgi:hypothetical protein